MATIRYLAHDVEQSIAFYTRSLGFRFEQQMGRAVAEDLPGRPDPVAGGTAELGRAAHGGRTPPGTRGVESARPRSEGPARSRCGDETGRPAVSQRRRRGPWREASSVGGPRWQSGGAL
jgi:catechol 2,3-dioxygenase-like lactoylglutathione lyase family enzyme